MISPDLPHLLIFKKLPYPVFKKVTLWVKTSTQGSPGGSVVRKLHAKETWVQSLVQEDPTRHRATKPVHPKLLSLWSRAHAATAETQGI